jgi:hypothetical protein
MNVIIHECRNNSNISSGVTTPNVKTGAIECLSDTTSDALTTTRIRRRQLRYHSWLH